MTQEQGGANGSASLPQFTYYPDPVGGGSIKPSDEACACCGKARGYVYTGRLYSRFEDTGPICPWCIHDGAAASRFDGEFVDAYGLEAPSEVRDTILHRTPGYETWQGAIWFSHCNDACEFRGEMTGERFAAIPDEVVERAAADDVFIEEWKDNRADYQRGLSYSVYEFRCRHCGEIILHADAC